MKISEKEAKKLNGLYEKALKYNSQNELDDIWNKINSLKKKLSIKYNFDFNDYVISDDGTILKKDDVASL